MPKAVKGIYEKGKIRLPLNEIPEENTRIQVIVVFLEPDTKINLKESLPEDLNISLQSAPEKESYTEGSIFSTKKSKFFSLPSENFGATSASEIDKIIAEEALGRK